MDSDISDTYNETKKNKITSNNESFQLIDLTEKSHRPKNDIESNLGMANASASSQTTLNANKRTLTFRNKSLNLLASIKNTTLSASRVLAFKQLTDEPHSRSFDKKNESREPIDLEAHIIFGGQKKVKDSLTKKFLKKKKSQRDEHDDDDDDDDDYNDDVFCNNETNILNIDSDEDDDLDDYDEDDDNEGEDRVKEYHDNFNIETKQNNEKNNGSFEDEEENGYDENFFADKNYENEELIKVFANEDKPTYDNIDTIDDMQTETLTYDSMKNNDQICRRADVECRRDSIVNFNGENKIQIGKSLSEFDESLPVFENKKNSKIVRRNTDLTINHLLKIQPNKSRKSFSFKQQAQQNKMSPTSPPGITTKSKLNLNLPVISPVLGPSIIKNGLSTNRLTPNHIVNNRQSVSFKENGRDENASPGDKNFQRTISSQQPTINLPMPASSNDLESEYLKSFQNKSDYDTKGSHLSPYYLSSCSSTSHLLSNTSISSNVPSTNYSSSLGSKMLIQPNNPNNFQQPVSIRVLQKSMTTGSKAMRIMGNNSTLSSEATSKSSISSKNSTMSRSTSAALKKQQQRRLFFKNGNINISRSNINKRRRRYLTDIFTTLIDLKWRYNILFFAFGFLVSWIGFAGAWYGISYIHGDLLNPDKNHVACISGLNTFISAILFSIETQQTIGYGARFTTEKCPEAIFIMMIQSSIGVMIQSFMVGVVFAKLSRPKKRSETLMFSKNAVISLRDGRLCLICRVGDMRKSHIVEAHVRMYLIKKKVTLEGEIMPLHMYDLNVGWDRGTDRLFLVWPLTIEHYIDDQSPFWNISADDLKKERFELAVILEGIVESTGMTTQARSSYLCNEILWGHRFEKLITFQKEDGAYKIDYSRFNMTIPIDTPTCSAKDLNELKNQEQFYSGNFSESMPSTIYSRDTYCESNFNNDLRRRHIESKDECNDETENLVTVNNLVPDKSEEKNQSQTVNRTTSIDTKNIPEIIISK